jgi:hypothetical protein
MSQFTRVVAATLAIGLVLAVPAANARLIDDPKTEAATQSEPAQNLRGADAQGAPTAAPTADPSAPTWPLNPEPIVTAPEPATTASDDESPLVYILPSAAIALMLGAALGFAVRPRRARATA